jgi:hypothetical protein
MRQLIFAFGLQNNFRTLLLDCEPVALQNIKFLVDYWMRCGMEFKYLGIGER